VINVINVVN